MNIFISSSSGEPIYGQISNQIKNHIFNGELKEGDSLPSIRSLANGLKISVITTKRAYEELENEGFIETIPKKGSYVTWKNKEILKEKQVKLIEDSLIKAIEDSKLISLSLEDLKKMMDILYKNTK